MGQYTTVSDVEAYIYTSVSNTFSTFSPVRNITVDSAANLVFAFDSIVIDPAFDGSLTIKLQFVSATQYEVYLDKDDVFSNLFYLTGDIATDMTAYGITIPAGTIGGTVTTGDKITFTVRRDISTNNMESVILDAEAEINSYANSLRMLLPVHGTDYIFPVLPDTPRDIRLAARMWATAFVIERRMLQGATEMSDDSYIFRLKNSARKKVRQALERMMQQAPIVDDGLDMSSGGATLVSSLTDLSSNCGITQFEDCCDDE